MAKSDKNPPAEAPDRWFGWGLFLLTLVLYGQTAGFDFVNFDDPLVLTENPHVRAGLTGESIWWALTTNFIYWQPLVYLSHMAVVAVFGLAPAAHHVVNALLHAGNAALFFLVLRQLRLSAWSAAAAAAVFAFHPLRVESVAWVTERKDVLSALFWLLTMRAYIHYTEAPGERRRYGMVLLYFVLGLMAKPMLVILPVALLVLDYWPLRRGAVPLRDRIREKIPMAVLAAGVALATFAGQQAAGAMTTLESLPVSLRAANVIRSYVVYLWKTIWPVDLAVIYPYPASYPAWEIVACAAVLGGITYWAWQRRVASPWWITAWVWYLLVSAPTIGFLQVGPVPYADRFAYLPSLLPLAAVAFAAGNLLTPGMFRAGGAALAGVLFVMSWVQTGTWRDDITLYRHAISAAPGSAHVHINLGIAMAKIGRFNEAIANYEEAQALDPTDPEPPLNIGIAYLATGRAPQAIVPLRRAMELQPQSARPYFQYSRALLETGSVDESEKMARKALTLSPSPGMAAALHAQIGMAAYLRKDDPGALAGFLEAIRLDPNHWLARKNAGIALGNMGRNREAIEQFEIYLAANPQDKDVAAAVAALRGAR